MWCVWRALGIPRESAHDRDDSLFDSLLPSLSTLIGWRGSRDPFLLVSDLIPSGIFDGIEVN